MSFTIGCDPEIFIRHNNKPISAHGLIPGTKEAPFKTSNGAVQVDGMALELNTNPVPLDDFQAFNLNIVKQIATLREMVNKDSERRISLSLQPTQDFPKELMDDQPDEAKELGCDPDWNAYTLAPNPRPNADNVLFRTAAGHIHVGWGAGIPTDNEEHIAICAKFVKNMDLTVGLLMTFIDRDPRRRELYGKAGAFRPKPYGVEYRTPSNVWLQKVEYRRLIHTLTLKAVSNTKYGRSSVQLFGITEEETQRIINEGDYEEAKRFLDSTLWGSNKDWGTVKKIFEEKKNVARAA